MSEKKEKVPFLDLYRCICIIAVITIHVTSDPVVKLAPYPRINFIYLGVNLLCGFAVPAFLFLSAFVLFYNYEDRWNLVACRYFFSKRLTFTLVPYLFWSFFYYVGVRMTMDRPVMNDIDQFFSQLLIGKNYAHLYYIVIIIQFYFLFPFLIMGVKRFRFFKKNLFSLAVIFQISFYLINKFYLHIQATGSLACSYILFYFLGAYLALNYHQAVGWLNHRLVFWITGWLFAGGILLMKTWLTRNYSYAAFPWMSYINFLTYYIYAACSCVTLFLLSHRLYQKWQGRLSLFAHWGRASFFIYLAHPAILLLWRNYFIVTTQYAYHLTTILGGIAALLIPWLVYSFLGRFKYAWLLMGQTNAPVPHAGSSLIKELFHKN